MLQYNNIPLLRSAALTRVNVIARAIQTGPGSTDVLLWAVGRRAYLPHGPVVEHGAPNAAVVVLCVLLQEATSNSGLSSTLKERFGGLKRFIEGYPDIFLVATDHRFNPLVYLCSGLTIEQSTQIKAGVSLTSNNQRIIDQGGNGDGVPATTTASKRNSRRKTRKGNSSRKRNKALKKQNSNAGKHETKEEKIGAASGGGGGGLGSNQLQATAVEFVPSF